MWEVEWKVEVLVVQLCPTLCDPMDCNPPGSCVHGILQARILEWVAIPFAKGSAQTWILHCRQIFLPPEPPGKHQEMEYFLPYQ